VSGQVSVIVGEATVVDVEEGDVALLPLHAAVVSASVNRLETSRE
jgi:hypothetical protein